MTKLTFLGAGSTIFAKNVCGDLLIDPDFKALEIALFDIDATRMEESYHMLKAIQTYANSTAKIICYTDRKEALRNADFVVNAIQVGGYDPCTITDFEIPKRFGLRQTIGDTLGIGGIFRALRTIHVLESIAKDMHDVCPNALFLNYTNPMASLTGYLIQELHINAIGLCHSVQVCVKFLLESLKMEDYVDTCTWTIAGINHQAWLLTINDEQGNNLYPEIKRRSLSGKGDIHWDLVRHDMMHRFGCYLTESSEHSAEYSPWYIKKNYPKLIERYNIPLDEYPRRCIAQINNWENQKILLTQQKSLSHSYSNEYARLIMRAILLNEPIIIHGNVINNGIISNLPNDACVEIPCLIDKDGIHPQKVGSLPPICAAINQTNINVHLLTIEAAKKRSKKAVFQAAALDPHTAAECSLDDITQMVKDLFEAHKDWLPTYTED